jgi:hypothetical protein
MIVNLLQVWKYHLSIYNEAEYKGPVEAIKNRMERLFQYLIDQAGTKSHMWFGYA